MYDTTAILLCFFCAMYIYSRKLLWQNISVVAMYREIILRFDEESSAPI